MVRLIALFTIILVTFGALATNGLAAMHDLTPVQTTASTYSHAVNHGHELDAASSEACPDETPEHKPGKQHGHPCCFSACFDPAWAAGHDMQFFSAKRVLFAHVNYKAETTSSSPPRRPPRLQI